MKIGCRLGKIAATAWRPQCFGIFGRPMAVAMRQLDMGITYAVWAASGTAAAAVVGMALFGEPVGVIKVVGLVCVVGGVVMLHLGSPQ